LKGDLMKSLLAILAAALAVIAIGVTAAMHGEADDAPGLALIGIVLIVGAFVLSVRTAYRVGLSQGRNSGGAA
jgi:multisubunit Na+/H+ antiporter MnhB subunit